MKIQSWLSSAGAIGLLSVLSLTPSADAAQTALPGTINYIEGQVSINGNLLNSRQEGNVSLQTNDILSTDQGKVEVLLSPGAFLRVGSNSQIRMVSPGMGDPTIEVMRGEAMVEVDYLPKLARLDVLEHGADAALLKEGLYRFNADRGSISVFGGKTQVSDGDGKMRELGKGKELVLTDARLKTVGFDTKAPDELYRWSAARAGYLAEANESSARTVYVAGGWGPYGWGPGWAWNPYFATWSWLPGDGFFLSPFGYPFFSPGYVAYAPYYGRGFYGGGRGFFPGRAGIAAAPAFRGGGFGGGFARGGGGRR